MIAALPSSSSQAPSAYYVGQAHASNQTSNAIAASDIRQMILAEMHEEAMDSCHDGWDGYGAKAISREAYCLASRFVDALPAHLPKPRVVTDPDGWFAFEWSRGRRKGVVVSIDPAYRVHYSALLGPTEMHGSEPFFDRLPESVEHILQRLYRL